ncbi:hypothetical protein F2Q69_00040673 [Brassica cretica]|uniref:Uncharacterized protein n=1 Tax=Brassica cretica TaxID=69181 RepID=A0A8S9NR76_BRACR|nr:hypothetical protein F2Q69_00040673 [Brassica cretica]
MEFSEAFGCIWSLKESDAEKSLAFSSRGHTKTRPERRLAATPPGRYRSLERPYQSDAENSLAFSSLGHTKTFPERHLAATPPGRSRSLERPLGATTGGRCAPIVCSNSFLLKGLLVISLCTFYTF